MTRQIGVALGVACLVAILGSATGASAVTRVPPRLDLHDGLRPAGRPVLQGIGARGHRGGRRLGLGRGPGAAWADRRGLRARRPASRRGWPPAAGRGPTRPARAPPAPSRRRRPRTRMAAASAASSVEPEIGQARARAPRRWPGRGAARARPIRSALRATRASKRAPPSPCAITSVSRYSRTASTSSAAVGRPNGAATGDGAAGPAARSGLGDRGGHAEQDEEVPLALADPPADGGQLDRAAGAAQVGRGLQRADDRPLDRGVDLPPRDPVACRSASPPGGGVAPRAGRRGRRTRRPGRGPPKRQAGAQSQPMSSAGSPAWASSQSSTPRRPSGPTRRLPMRKSPCTVTRGTAAAGGGPRASARPARAPGRTSPSASRKGRGSASGSAGGQPVDGAGVDGVDGGQGPPALGGRARPGRRPIRVAQDLAGDGLPLEALDDQPVRRRARRASRRPPPRARGRRRRRPPEQGRLASATRPPWRRAVAPVHAGG